MNKAAQHSNKIINVIDEFDYSTQNESYNRQFKKWRREKENKFSFRFSSNKNESIFIDGKGFVSENAVSAEKETPFKNILYCWKCHAYMACYRYDYP